MSDLKELTVEQKPAAMASKSADPDPRVAAVFPVLVGVFVLGLNAFVFYRQRGLFVTRNLPGTVALTLLVISVFTGVLLIAYATLIGRAERIMPERHRVGRWVVVPVLLGVLASLATIRALEAYPSVSEAQSGTPCLELYQQAHTIHKDNPAFRMPANDRDERRCRINDTVLK